MSGFVVIDAKRGAWLEDGWTTRSVSSALHGTHHHPIAVRLPDGREAPWSVVERWCDELCDWAGVVRLSELPKHKLNRASFWAFRALRARPGHNHLWFRRLREMLHDAAE